MFSLKKNEYCYDIHDSFDAHGGCFNSFLIFVVIFGFPLRWILVPSLFLLPVCFSVRSTMFLAPRLFGKQLIVYLRLWCAVFWDMKWNFSVAFLLFALLHRVCDSWADFLMWGTVWNQGEILFWAYFVVRVPFLCWKLYCMPSDAKKLVGVFLLGNIGLTARCFKYEIWKKFSGWLVWSSVGDVSLDPLLVQSHILFFAIVGFVVGMEIRHNAQDNLLFYKIHRSIHASPTLYSFLHALHHKAISPTMLDSGSISPFELILTDLSMPTLLLCAPNFFVVGFEFIAGFWHFRAHQADDSHHYKHHENQKYNFGLMVKFDKQFGTLLLDAGHRK